MSAQPKKGWKQLSEKTSSLLRLKTEPTGVKLFKDVKDVPSKATRVNRRCTVCQMLAFPRWDIAYQGCVVAATKDDVVCAMGGSALGFYALPEDMASGERALHIYSDTKEVNARIMGEIERIKPETFSAVMTFPLSKAPIDPDVIITVCNSGQAVILAYGVSWKEGKNIEARTSGHQGICSEAIAVPFLLKEPRLALPCYGAHRFGVVADDEIIISIPGEQFEEVVFGMERASVCGQVYPIRLHGLRTPPEEILPRMVRTPIV